jgi:guanylate kinase
MRKDRDKDKTGGAVGGIAFILSAPSGAGKTTIAHRVVKRMQGMRISISHTTRPPRGRERDGRDYHFVTPDEFLRMEREGVFLETASVHDNYYGTHRDEVVSYLAAGTDVILDIDVQGAAIIRKKIDTVGIFILPPDMDELIRRLSLRNTDEEATVSRRIANARREVADAPSYDYLVINDELERAVAEVISIVTAERLRMAKRRAIVDAFLKDHG